MGDLANFTSALLGAVDTGNDFYAKKMEEQAKFDASNISIRLQREANDMLLQMQQSNSYDTWSTDMDNFFQERLNAMENKDSPYYCRNNQTARYVNDIIEQSRNNYQFKVDQMVVAKQREMDIANYNQRCNDIDAMYSGQENIDLKNTGAKQMLDKGTIDILKYQELTEKNYWTGAYNNCVNNFNDSLIDTAIKAGKDFNETWKSYSAAVEMPKKYGIDGFEVAGNNKEILEKAQKECEAKYNSALISMQNGNLQWFVNDYADINSDIINLATGHGNKTYEQIKTRINIGVNKCDTMSGNSMATGRQKEVSDWYNRLLNDLDAIKDLNSGNLKTAAKAIAKLDPEASMLYYKEAAKNGALATEGGAQNIYTSKQLFIEDFTKQFQTATGNENATWEDAKKAYPKIATFLDYCKKDLPPVFQDINNYAEIQLKEIFNSKENKELYQEEYNTLMAQLYDLEFETDIDSLDATGKQNLKDKVNKVILANYGSMLTKSKKKELAGKDYVNPDTLSNYREGVFQDKIISKAMWERDNNPQLIYTNEKGATIPSGSAEIQKGLTYLEADERRMLAETLGINKDDIGKYIKSNYEAEGSYDRTARNVYTVETEQNGEKVYTDYRFRAIDKDNYVLERKKTGTTKWEQIQTKKQEEKNNKPENVVDRYIKTKDISKLPPIDKKIPVGGGRFMQLNQSLWETRMDKKQLLLEWYQRDPEAAEAYFNSLPERQKEENPIKDRKKK